MGNLIIPENFGLFTVRFDRTGGVSDKRQSFHLGGRLGTAPDADDMLDQFIAAWVATGSFNEAQPNDVVAVNLNLLLRTSAGLFSLDRPNPWAAGGGSPSLCSPAVSYTIKTHTALAGRRFRGRFQLPWAVEGEVGELGDIASTVVTAYNAAAEVFRLAFVSDATKLQGPYLLHSIVGLAPTIITKLTLRNTVGTVRKRQVVGS